MYYRIVLIALLILTSVSLQAAGPHGTQAGQPFTNTGQVTLTDAVAQTLADAGVGFVRVNFRLGNQLSDTPAWYAAYDGIVDRLRSRGIEVIGLMTNEAWRGGQSEWQKNAYETTGGNGWNPYLEDWCNFFKRAAQHWQGKIKYWELWNEPDCLAVIYPSNYGALLANAYDLVHTANIPVEIVSGGVCGGYGQFGPGFITSTYDVSINHTGWFKQMKEKWGTYPLDYIGFHIYPNCDRRLDTTWLSAYFDDVHNAYTAYEGANTTKKMFLTEIGWQTGGTGCHTTESVQASNLTAAFNVANSKPYIKCVTWFFLQDEPAANLYFGVFRSTGLTDADKKPSWNNLKTACTFEGRESDETIDLPILNYFNSKGHAVMGNPYDSGGSAWVHPLGYGPVQDYDGGTYGKMTVFDSADDTGCSVRGNIYPALSTDFSTLEFPLGDQYTTGTGERQKFEGGYATWTQSNGLQISPFTNKLVEDDSDQGFTASSSWTQRATSDAYKGICRRRSGTSSNTDPAVWSLSLAQAGYYDIYVRYPADSAATASANYEVVNADGTATVSVNQQSRTNRWNRLGTYRFNAGTVTIRLSSQGNSTEYITADAVRIVGPVPGPDTTAPTTPIVTDDGHSIFNHNPLHASWVSVDMESGIDRYEYAIGTTSTDPGSGYIVPWTSTGTATSVTTSVSLAQGTTYYFYIRAYNTLGMMSEGVSDGITADSTPPSQPVVIDDGDYTGSPSTLHCSWSSGDVESGIDDCQYCIGTTKYGTDVLPWTDAGTTTQAYVTGLNLVQGKTYYFTVKTHNTLGLWSALGATDGIRRDSALEKSTISEILALPDSTVVMLRNKIVSGLFYGRFYILEADRTAGISVSSAILPLEGAAVDVTGTLSTVDGERRITPGAVTPLPQP